MDNQASREALERVVEIVGSQSMLARFVGVRQQAVSQWVRRGVVPAARCRAVSEATNGIVSVAELRPDLFGASRAA